MGATGQGALIGLSNMITARAEREHQRQLMLEDEQRKNQNEILDKAITSGNLTPEQIQAALEQKKKLYPKETHPLIDQFGQVLGHVFNLKKKSQANAPMSEQPPVAGVPSSTGVTTSGSVMGPDGQPIAPMPAPGASTSQSSAPATPAVSPMASIIAAANPGPIAAARTAAHAQLAGNEVLQGDRNQRADKLIEDLKASGALTPQAEQAIRMEAQGFAVPPTMLRPMTGKQLKPIVKDGVYMGMENPMTNETYATAKDAPPEYQDEATKLEASVTKALKEKADADEAKQQRSFDHQMTMHEKAVNDSIRVGDYRAAKKAVNEAQDTVDDAIDRMKTMDKNLIDLVQTTQEGHPNQQAALSLVANHIGMTLGLQKGARITKAVWDEAQMSAPWLSRVGARWSSDGYLTGLNITPEQGKQMVQLAHERVQTIRERADRVRDRYADDLPQATQAVPAKMKTPKKGASSVDDDIMNAVKKAKGNAN